MLQSMMILGSPLFDLLAFFLCFFSLFSPLLPNGSFSFAVPSSAFGRGCTSVCAFSLHDSGAAPLSKAAKVASILRSIGPGLLFLQRAEQYLTAVAFCDLRRSLMTRPQVWQ